MKMPFGKYKGLEITELTPAYCKTLLEHVPIKDEDLKGELERRAKKYKPIRTSRFHEMDYMSYSDDPWAEPDDYAMDYGWVDPLNE